MTEDARLSPLFTWRSAITESELSHKARHVALTLSLHMNERGGSCFPTLETLAAETSRGKATVIEALRELEAGGWLAVDRKPSPGRGHKNRYTATVPEGFSPGPFLEKRVLGLALKGSGAAPKDVKEDGLKEGLYICQKCDGLVFKGPLGLKRHLYNVHDVVAA